MAKLAARHAGTETVVTDGDLLVDELVSEVIGPLRHGPDKYADTLRGLELRDVLSNPNNGCVEAERDLPAFWWEMISDRILDDL